MPLGRLGAALRHEGEAVSGLLASRRPGLVFNADAVALLRTETTRGMLVLVLLRMRQQDVDRGPFRAFLAHMANLQADRLVVPGLKFVAHALVGLDGAAFHARDLANGGQLVDP